jgi:hypothetical protein
MPTKKVSPYGVYPPADGEQAADKNGRETAHEPLIRPLDADFPAVFSLVIFRANPCLF